MRKMLKMLLGSVLLAITVTAGVSFAAEGLITYEKDVQSIISNLCQSCLGSDSPTLEAFKKDEERTTNLSVLKSWIGGWTLKRKAEITAEELRAIKAMEK